MKFKDYTLLSVFDDNYVDDLVAIKNHLYLDLIMTRGYSNQLIDLLNDVLEGKYDKYIDSKDIAWASTIHSPGHNYSDKRVIERVYDEIYIYSRNKMGKKLCKLLVMCNDKIPRYTRLTLRYIPVVKEDLGIEINIPDFRTEYLAKIKSFQGIAPTIRALTYSCLGPICYNIIGNPDPEKLKKTEIKGQEIWNKILWTYFQPGQEIIHIYSYKMLMKKLCRWASNMSEISITLALI